MNSEISPCNEMCVKDSVDSIDAFAIQNLLHGKISEYAAQWEIKVVEETGSTNVDLMTTLAERISPQVLIAKRQTAGRGRAGRQWHTNDNQNQQQALTFSLSYYFHRPLRELSGLPLAVGVAIAQALKHCSVPVQLKWPNDVLKEGKKLAGVLVETQHIAQHFRSTSNHPNRQESCVGVVIGVGMNLLVSDELESKIGHAVASSAWLSKMDKNTLYATLLQSLFACIKQYESDGFASFVKQWNAHHAYQNAEVKMVDAGVIKQQGIALGVDEQGCLLLQTSQGIERVWSGDVSLRPVFGS